jgi:DNA-binding transcriptional LysR family regulator
MNIHHLELFYYVARHGGISEAVRNIPYGIQQPAVSAQILQLEDTLGLTLFQRRPFVLTPAGEKLYRFIQPFFDNISAVAEELRGGPGQQIRIGASQIVLRDHLPEIVQQVRKKFPKLKLTLREAYQPQLEQWLQRQEIDLALTVLETKPPSGIHATPLLKLPLILIAHKKRGLTSAKDLWKRDRIEEPLLCLPANELICKNFQQGLNRMGIDWFPSTELSSLELIHTYVENDEGIGLSVAAPQAKLSPNICALALEGFASVDFGVLWQGKPNALTEAFTAAFKARASLFSTPPKQPAPAHPRMKMKQPIPTIQAHA